MLSTFMDAHLRVIRFFLDNGYFESICLLFADNTCKGNGGVIYLNSMNTLTVQGSTLSSKLAFTFSYALLLQFVLIELPSMIVDNLAKDNGGGIYFGTNNTMTVYDSSLIGMFVCNLYTIIPLTIIWCLWSIK